MPIAYSKHRFRTGDPQYVYIYNIPKSLFRKGFGEFDVSFKHPDNDKFAHFTVKDHAIQSMVYFSENPDYYHVAMLKGSQIELRWPHEETLNGVQTIAPSVMVTPEKIKELYEQSRVTNKPARKYISRRQDKKVRDDAAENIMTVASRTSQYNPDDYNTDLDPDMMNLPF